MTKANGPEVFDQEPVSVMYTHAKMVYDAMFSAAKPEDLDGTMGLVYSGFLTKLIADLKLSVPYYTKVMRDLKRMGCVRQLRRGGGHSPSLWLMLAEPSEEAFQEGNATRLRNRSGSRIEALEQQVRDLAARIAVLEDVTTPRWAPGGSNDT